MQSGRGYGEIGRHARFRFWCRKAWEFKSLYPHQNCRARSEPLSVLDMRSAKPRLVSLKFRRCALESLAVEHRRHDMKV